MSASESSLPDSEYPANGPIRWYVLLVLILLPMDYFAPTAVVFREFGAKPAILLLTLGGLCGLCFVKSRRPAGNSREFTALIVFAAWLALGCLAALTNFMAGWSGWNADRSPFGQLLAQAAMVMVCAIAVIGNTRLTVAFPVIPMVIRYLPLAVLVHLAVFILNIAGVLSDSTLPLSLFRVDVIENIRKPTALFTEPSYFGTFAALYGMALLCLRTGPGRRFFHALLAIGLFASSIAIGAKTFVVVLGAQVLYFVLHRTRSLASAMTGALLLLVVSACALYFIVAYSALDVRENLSSADRLGSAVLATNVALQGYALPGIGFGQFHFFYRDQFAPDFLFLSREASLTLSADGGLRASTYNFYLRVLLETGLTGFVIFAVAIKRLWNEPLQGPLTFIAAMFAGALGFLMTQDAYFYPPLVFSTALILGLMELRRRARLEALGRELALT